jgi:dGTP triphosphohydrolase
MPSVETGVINKIVENLKKAKKVSDANGNEKIAIDMSEYELVISEYMDALLTSSFDTEISASEDDVSQVESQLDDSISKSIASHSITVPFINKVMIDKDAVVNDIKKDATKIFEAWFNEGLVNEIRKDLLKTARSKLKEVEESVRPNIPKSIEEQLIGLVSEKEVLELGKEQSRSRYFVSEMDVIDYYTSANMLSYYPSYSDFLSALKNHLSAKIILGVNEERYVSLPMKGSS